MVVTGLSGEKADFMMVLYKIKLVKSYIKRMWN